MAGGYCLNWTAWRVWLHPHKARRRIEEADNVENDLQNRLDETLALLERQSKETSIQTFKVAELSRRLTETDKHLADEHRELEETRLKLTKALDALAEQKSVDEKLAEFEKELSKVEALKRGYEKRINELEARLGDARKRLAVADDTELIEPINMATPRRFQTPPPKLRPNGYSARPNSSGQQRPSSGQSHPTTFVPKRNNSTEEPQGNSTEKSAHSEARGGYSIPQIPEAKANASSYISPLSNDKISGTPEETAKKVSDYLNVLHKNGTGHSDDWLSEPPSL